MIGGFKQTHMVSSDRLRNTKNKPRKFSVWSDASRTIGMTWQQMQKFIAYLDTQPFGKYEFEIHIVNNEVVYITDLMDPNSPTYRIVADLAFSDSNDEVIPDNKLWILPEDLLMYVLESDGPRPQLIYSGGNMSITSDGLVKMRHQRTLEIMEVGVLPEHVVKAFDDYKKCVIRWSDDDVKNRATKLKIACRDVEAQEIVNKLKHDHDCNHGISWETIDVHLNELDAKHKRSNPHWAKKK